MGIVASQTVESGKMVVKPADPIKEGYPEGMPWTNDNQYKWNGSNSVGFACAGFAFIMSDAAFGYLPARKHNDFNNIRVGDILRVNNDTHSVIVFGIDGDTVTVTEGNFNDSVHWGREIDISDPDLGLTYVMTRYPEK